MTVQEATYQLLQQLRPVYGDGEAAAMTDLVMEYLTGSGKAERMIYKQAAISVAEEEKLKEIIQRLLAQEPLQYVLGEAWFCGFRFVVGPGVLIPRPETEELVEWVIADCKFPVDELSILDIGTGSGCIAVSLKRRIRKARVWACDISQAALDIARKNATLMGAPVEFVSLDFLDPSARDSLPAFDIIISNPPYIPPADKSGMQPNVLEHEPHQALFVPEQDALVFYRAIAAFGQSHLNPGGAIYTETHENLGPATRDLFRGAGYETELKKDMQGKDRMIRSRLGKQPMVL